MTKSSQLLVDVGELRDWARLQAEMISSDTQLGNFELLRNHLVASGQDADARYREIVSRRQQAIEELKALREKSVDPAPEMPPIPSASPGSALSLPIVPPALDVDLRPSFGFSGSVQMGRAKELFEDKSDGVTGSFRTRFTGDNSWIDYGGDISAAPADPHPKSHFILKSWYYLVPLPMPAVPSIVTYSFTAGGWTSIGEAIGPGQIPTVFWSWVAIGERAAVLQDAYTQPKNVGFPIIQQLAYPDFAYQFPGKSEVRRSFVVGYPGSQPALTIAVGVALNIESGAHVRFDEGYTNIIVGSVGPTQFEVGKLDFNYRPLIVVSPGG